MKQFIVAIDFDNTIANSHFPDIGDMYEGAKEVINKWHQRGAYIIIWTCRSGRGMYEAEQYLLDHGVHFHKINEQHPHAMLDFASDIEVETGRTGRKVWSHVLIDDTSIDWMVRGSHPGWDVLDKQLEQIVSANPDKWSVKLPKHVQI